MSNEKPKNRPPAFQFYPDKWQAHTRRLSDRAYRVYHEMLCWMWMHSPDYCSMPTDPDAVASLLAMDRSNFGVILEEIQNTFSPLLKVRRGRFVSDGLRKEKEKQAVNSSKASKSASVRWSRVRDANALRTHDSSKPQAMLAGCSPSPSPSPSVENTSYSPPNPQGGVAWGLHSRLLETGKFPNLTVATVAAVVRSFPKAPEAVVLEAVPRLAMDAPALRIQAPDRWLRARLSEIEHEAVSTPVAQDPDFEKKKKLAELLPRGISAQIKANAERARKAKEKGGVG